MAVPLSDNPTIIAQHLARAVDEIIQREKEKFITEAVKDFETLLRKKVGEVAIRAADFYSVERIGATIRIEVKIAKSN